MRNNRIARASVRWLTPAIYSGRDEQEGGKYKVCSLSYESEQRGVARGSLKIGEAVRVLCLPGRTDAYFIRPTVRKFVSSARK